jgi:hypothetical protein
VIGTAAVGRTAIFEREPSGTLVRDEEGNPVLLQRAVNSDWQAAAWRLERMYPARYGSRQRIRLEDMSTDELDAEIRKLETKLAEAERRTWADAPPIKRLGS